MSGDERLDRLTIVIESQASAPENRINRLLLIGEARRNVMAARNTRIEALMDRMEKDLTLRSNSPD
jgi:hypothetical protein